MSIVLSQARPPVSFILSEAAGHRSRENIVIANGQGKVKPGTVLAESGVGTAVTAAKSGGNTGNGVLTMDPTAPVGNGAKPGVYTLRLIAAAANAGTFRVEDPDGFVLGDYTVGAAAFSDDIKFTVADGATDFIVGDGFDITVTPTQKKYVVASAAMQGSAICLYGVDATSADAAVSAVVRDCEVNGKILYFAADVDTNSEISVKYGELARSGIIVR